MNYIRVFIKVISHPHHMPTPFLWFWFSNKKTEETDKETQKQNEDGFFLDVKEVENSHWISILAGGSV